jgi:5-formyltetrahydrofolate cyclo-ligase
MALEFSKAIFFILEIYNQGMFKAEIRKQVLAQRLSLTDEEFVHLNEKLLENFKNLDLSGIKNLHVFLPIVKNREPNTFLLIAWLATNHPELQIVVSKSDFTNHSMSNHPFLGEADLIEGKFQIPEPKTDKLFDENIDMVLVPLLAFDKQGFRVGYGKGFYDRFLAGKRAVKVGVSLFDAIDAINDVHLDDIKLDLCISPKQIYRFVV